MQISGVVKMFDNGEFITITTASGSMIHLPSNSKHNIILDVTKTGAIFAIIDFNQA